MGYKKEIIEDDQADLSDNPMKRPISDLWFELDKGGQKASFFTRGPKQKEVRNDDVKYEIVYSDGACTGNGTNKAIGGIGVYFGENDPRNTSERLDNPATNQRAELTAALRALQLFEEDKNLEIRTDSMYTINCVTAWSKTWIANGWKTKEKKPVLNQELIKEILEELKKRTGLTKWTHVKGHRRESESKDDDDLHTIKGNNAADRLAVDGCELPLPPKQQKPNKNSEAFLKLFNNQK
jgi:ribonuclease HI